MPDSATITNEFSYGHRGNAYLWTDPHVSNQMLAFHLDPDADAASRDVKTVDRTVTWIADQLVVNGSAAHRFYFANAVLVFDTA